MAFDGPTGSYTFLFTDIEGSTRLWDTRRAEMSPSLAEHDRQLREVCERNGGQVFKTVGDAFCVAFETPADAVRAALEGQNAIKGMSSPLALRVRMALHTGSAERRNEDYFGPTLNRVARLLSGGHGGQVLLSAATFELTQDSLPAGASTVDFGEHRLRDLASPERVYGLVHPSLESCFAPLRTLDSLPNNLPKQTTRFIGREEELAKLREMLAGSRLVTLAGPGGVGKSRIALQAGAALLDRFPDGVWWVELAPVGEPSRLASAIGEALGVAERPGVSMEASLRDHLREKELLLALDNCEHLIDAVASFADALVRVCAKVRILSSSREPLNVAGEQVYRLPPLRTPEGTESPSALEGYEAVELFTDRARLVSPSFAIDEGNARAVAGICTQLSGIPLALELAASRLKSLSPAQIHERLGDAFRILTGGSRTALPRQQTLRGAIDWSYNLLEEKERIVFRRLSAFSGGWDLEAAEAVVPDPEGEIEGWEVLDLLASLVDKSLVVVDERLGETRYRLLETVRQYAAEKLGDDAASVRDRHLAYFVDLAELANAPTESNADGGLGIRLHRQSDNVRAALRWAASLGEWETAVGFACALHRTCLMRWNVSEVCALWDRLLAPASGTAPTKLLANAYAHASWYSGQMRDVEKARLWADAGIAVAQGIGDRVAVGRVLNALGSLYFHLERLDESEEVYRRALDEIRDCNYPRANISIGLNLGLCLQAKGDLEGARAAFETVWPLIEKGNDPLNKALIVRYMGELLVEEMSLERGEAVLEEGLRLSVELEIEVYAAETLTTSYGMLPMLRGDPETARVRLEKGLDLGKRLALASCQQAALARLVRVCAATGDFAAASRYLAATSAESLPPREKAVLLRSAGWLALGMGAPDLAAHLAVSATLARESLPANLTPYEAEEQRSLRSALGDPALKGSPSDPGELIRRVVARAISAKQAPELPIRVPDGSYQTLWTP